MDFKALIKSLPDWLLLTAFFLAPGVGFFAVVFPELLTSLEVSRLLLFSACISAPGAALVSNVHLTQLGLMRGRVLSKGDTRDIVFGGVAAFGLFLCVAEVILFFSGWHGVSCFAAGYAISAGAASAFLFAIEKFVKWLGGKPPNNTREGQ